MRGSTAVFAALATAGVAAHGHGGHHEHKHAREETLTVGLDAAQARLAALESQISALRSHIEGEAEKTERAAIELTEEITGEIPLSLFSGLNAKPLTAHGNEASEGADHGAFGLDSLFVFGPLANALVAVAGMTALTAGLIRSVPDLRGLVLDALVGFAEGGMLGNVFVHLVPEVYEDGGLAGSIMLLGAFLGFCLVDKALKITMAGYGGHAHGHSHSHSHSHAASASPSSEPEVSTATGSARDDAGLTRRSGSNPAEKVVEDANAPSADAPPERAYVVALLNVAADFLHNITDGIALAAAFYDSKARGSAAFALMLLHEVPHQLGDYALLVQSGIGRAAGARAQLATSAGTFVGCGVYALLRSRAGSVVSADGMLALVTPFTAGVFLFISTVGILPEILEVDPRAGPRALVRQSLAQAAGLLGGLAASVLLS